VEHEANKSRFSRARLPPRERRVRVTQVTPAVDAAGRPFMAFAIDVRFGGDEWRENDIVGCAYTKSGELFVKRGDDFRPSPTSPPTPGPCSHSRRRRPSAGARVWC
jgi:hypothetical protein